MKVRMRTQMLGTRNGARWPGPGEVVDLPDQEAADLCSQDVAVPVVEEPRKATAKKAETRKS